MAHRPPPNRARLLTGKAVELPHADPARPRVTCVIPTHSRDDMLTEAVASVLAQTTPPAEILVVDDLASASTRATVARISETSDIPIVYVPFDPEGRGSAGLSRNRGASSAGGDLLAFLDDDDLWEPTFLAALLERMTAGGADMAVAWTDFERGDYRGEGLRMEPGLRGSDALGKNPGLTGSNFLISRAAFTHVGGFDPELWVANDKDFLIRFLDADLPYAVVREPLVLQRAHDAGQLTSRTERRALGLERFREKYSARLERGDERQIRRAICSIRRKTSPLRAVRAWYLLRQAATYSASELASAVTGRLRGRPEIYR